jgi:hypothetical protein
MKRAVIHHSDYQTEEEMKSAISLHFADRNSFFRDNPKRAGKKIWEIDFFQDYNNLKSGDYRGRRTPLLGQPERKISSKSTY